MRIPVSYLVSGMRLARPVYGRRGEMLLGRGAVLTARYIFRLRQCGVLAVCIEGPLDLSGEEEAEISRALEEQVQAEAVKAVRFWVESGRKRSFAAVVDKVIAIVDEILAGKTPARGLAEISSADSYTFAHSVDVCVLAVAAGVELDYGRRDLLRLGVGSLLHDLGKTKVPPEILNKPGRLTPNEFAEIKKHPAWGYRMLAESAGDEIDPASAAVALNHHERADGSGYPRGLKGEEMGDMAAICALADVYNAITTDRVYRKALPPHEAYEMLMGSGGTLFDFRLVRAFLKCVDPYPVGTPVRLSSGEAAVVVSTDRSLPFRPAVVLVRSGERVDLKKELSLVIERLLSPDEVREIALSTASSSAPAGKGRQWNVSASGFSAAHGRG